MIVTSYRVLNNFAYVVIACFYILFFHIRTQPDESLAKNETMLLLVLYKKYELCLTVTFIG
jgi:hypothetical protein